MTIYHGVLQSVTFYDIIDLLVLYIPETYHFTDECLTILYGNQSILCIDQHTD